MPVVGQFGRSCGYFPRGNEAGPRSSDAGCVCVILFGQIGADGQIFATASISTKASSGSLATSTQDLAGNALGK